MKFLFFFFFFYQLFSLFLTSFAVFQRAGKEKVALKGRGKRKREQSVSTTKAPCRKKQGLPTVAKLPVLI